MSALVVINSTDQDPSLGVAFDAAMQDRKWLSFDKIPYTFFKTYDTDIKSHKIEELVKKDIEDSVYEAEWSKIKYIVILTDKKPVVKETED